MQVCSLPLHRHSYVGFIFRFHFIDSYNKQNIKLKFDNERIIGSSYTDEGKTLIINKIIDVLSRSYRNKIIFYTSNRLSCLEWFELINNDDSFQLCFFIILGLKVSSERSFSSFCIFILCY